MPNERKTRDRSVQTPTAVRKLKHKNYRTLLRLLSGVEPSVKVIAGFNPEGTAIAILWSGRRRW